MTDKDVWRLKFRIYCIVATAFLVGVVVGLAIQWPGPLPIITGLITSILLSFALVNRGAEE